MGRPLYSTTPFNNCFCSANHDDSCPAHTRATSVFRSSTPPTETSSAHPVPRASYPDIVRTLAQSREYQQRVSTAIEAAYERLLALSNRLASSMDELQSSRGTSQMGPSHSAIILSNTQPVTPAHDRPDTVGDVVTQRLSDPAVAETARQNLSTIRQRFAELTSTIGDNPAVNPALSDGEVSRPSPTIMFGPRSRDALDTRRSLITSALLRNRHSNSTDGSTTLGRRVMARASSSRESLDSRVRDVLADSSFTVTVLNRHREQLLDTSRNFNSSGPRATETQYNMAPSSVPTHRSSETLATPPWVARNRTSHWRDNLQEHRPLPSYSNSRATDVGPRLRSLITLPQVSPAQASAPPRSSGDRIPPPDEFADIPGLEAEAEDEQMERLERPSSNFADIFDSSDDYDLFNWGVDGDSSLREPSPSSLRIGPAVRPSRPTTADTVLAPSVEPSLDAPAWSLLRDMAWTSYDSVEDQGTVQPYDSTSARRRRRRGWARLDQDGNEITTDEEEEYERNRAQMRSRAQVLSSRFQTEYNTTLDEPRYPPDGGAMPPPPPSRPRLSSVFTPTTRSDSLSLPDNDRYVRINLGPSSLRTTQSLPVSTDSTGPRRSSLRARRPSVSSIREIGSSTPFLASPIPWATVDLTPKPRFKAGDRKTSIKGRAGRAPLAGR